MENPFKLTRAADLNDEQIVSLWVDPDGALTKQLRPSSQLPMIILGGKGSGKTHLLRYHSYHIQHLIHGRDRMGEVVQREGYIGVYGRCSGLSEDRFSRKGFSGEQWQTLFAFYIDLWIGQLLLQTLCEFLADARLAGTFSEGDLTRELVELFDRPPTEPPLTLRDFVRFLRSRQREMDFAVNNASFSKVVMPEIIASPGALIFGIPRTFAAHVPALKRTIFALFIDEYEHLSERAQQHLNTLVRERENPVTFKIGARLYGFRTYRTFSGEEELREGSEYEKINLDSALRDKEGAYEKFAVDLCLSRVRFSLHGELPPGWTEANAADQFRSCFAAGETFEARVQQKLATRKRSPWLDTLARHLRQHTVRTGGLTIKKLNEIVQKLAHADPLVEKTNTFLLYRAWAGKENLLEAAAEIAVSAESFAADSGDRNTDHWRVLDKFRDDLRAQMLADLGLSQPYLGLSTWVRMSDGIARNLITTLKHIFDWASFHEENIFAPGGVSLRSQEKGVEAASEWFLNDSRVLGANQGAVKSGLIRVCSLLREMRYAEKPPECSLCTFEIDHESSRAEFARLLELAEQWSLLIRVGDRPDRNSAVNVLKCRISGMIAPKFGLPLFTRGSIRLSTEEVTAIFGNAPEKEFTRIMRIRESRVRPPFRESDSPHELPLF